MKLLIKIWNNLEEKTKSVFLVLLIALVALFTNFWITFFDLKMLSFFCWFVIFLIGGMIVEGACEIIKDVINSVKAARNELEMEKHLPKGCDKED